MIAGMLVTSVAWLKYQDYLELQRRSAVDHPLAMIIDNIAADVESGDDRRAGQKALALRDFWRDHLEGGPPPEQFYGAIIVTPPVE
jgi:hypothetical protein